MNTSVFALQSIRRMRGGSQSQLMRCSDGEYYVVKFQNNPQGVRTLANELLGTLLASQLGLPVPEIAVISVDGKLIKHTYDMAIEQQRGRTPCKAGRCIGSRYPRIEGSGADSLATVYGWLPLHLFPCVDNLAEFLGMLVFDSWVGNTDARQVICPDETRAATWPHCSYHALMIDEGFCFNACNWNFLPNRSHCLYDQAIVYEHVSGMNVFEKWLDRLEGQINRDTLDRAAEEIPSGMMVPEVLWQNCLLRSMKGVTKFEPYCCQRERHDLVHSQLGIVRLSTQTKHMQLRSEPGLGFQNEDRRIIVVIRGVAFTRSG